MGAAGRSYDAEAMGCRGWSARGREARAGRQSGATGMAGPPWAASCGEDCYKGYDGAAATAGSAGSPRFAWTCRYQGAVAIGPVGSHWVVAHVEASLQQGEATVWWLAWTIMRTAGHSSTTVRQWWAAWVSPVDSSCASYNHYATGAGTWNGLTVNIWFVLRWSRVVLRRPCVVLRWPCVALRWPSAVDWTSKSKN